MALSAITMRTVELGWAVDALSATWNQMNEGDLSLAHSLRARLSSLHTALYELGHGFIAARQRLQNHAPVAFSAEEVSLLSSALTKAASVTEAQFNDQFSIVQSTADVVYARGCLDSLGIRLLERSAYPPENTHAFLVTSEELWLLHGADLFHSAHGHQCRSDLEDIANDRVCYRLRELRRADIAPAVIPFATTGDERSVMLHCVDYSIEHFDEYEFGLQMPDSIGAPFGRKLIDLQKKLRSEVVG